MAGSAPRERTARSRLCAPCAQTAPFLALAFASLKEERGGCFEGRLLCLLPLCIEKESRRGNMLPKSKVELETTSPRPELKGQNPPQATRMDRLRALTCGRAFRVSRLGLCVRRHEAQKRSPCGRERGRGRERNPQGLAIVMIRQDRRTCQPPKGEKSEKFFRAVHGDSQAADGVRLPRGAGRKGRDSAFWAEKKPLGAEGERGKAR